MRRRMAVAPTGESLEVSRMILLGVIALLLCGVTEPMSTIPLGWFVIVALVSDLTPRRPATVTPIPSGAPQARTVESSALVADKK